MKDQVNCGAIANYFVAACGRNLAESLISSVKLMENGGICPAGIATVDDRGAIGCATRPEQIRKLLSMPSLAPIGGVGLIGGFRGQVQQTANAQQMHFGRVGRVCVVLSGEVDLKISSMGWLNKYGARRNKRSEADVIAYHIDRALKAGKGLHDSLRRALQFVPGRYTIAAIIEGENKRLIATSKGMPLYIGLSDDGAFLSSDASILPEAITCLFEFEYQDMLVVSKNGIEAQDKHGEAVVRRRLASRSPELGLSPDHSAEFPSGFSGRLA